MTQFRWIGQFELVPCIPIPRVILNAVKDLVSEFPVILRSAATKDLVSEFPVILSEREGSRIVSAAIEILRRAKPSSE